MRSPAIIGLFVLLSSSADACIVDPLISVIRDPAKYMQDGDFTFKGHVVAIEPAKMAADTYATLMKGKGQREERIIRIRMEETVVLTFEVEKVWKGQVQESFTAFYWNPGLECDVTPSVDSSFIVIGETDENGTNHNVMLIRTWYFEEIEPKLDAAIQQ